MLPRNGLVGFSLTGALVPAGLGKSCLIPLIKAGFIDWIITTGANLYHDIHYGLDMKLYRGSPFLDDVELRKRQIIRIYDILFDYSVLLDTDAFIRQVIRGREFQRSMGTDEFHYLLGKYVHQRERKLGLKDTSLISVAYQYGVPCFTSSPGDSSIGMNVAAMSLAGYKLQFDVNRDVNQTAGIVYDAKRSGRTSSVFILGGGSPKNFMLQTEPQIQEVLGLTRKATIISSRSPTPAPIPAASPARRRPRPLAGARSTRGLPDAVVCYVDSTVALPLITAYALDNFKPRKPKRLIDHRDRILDRVARDYEKSPFYKKFFEE
jgi:deoxyhypusine synthase